MLFGKTASVLAAFLLVTFVVSLLLGGTLARTERTVTRQELDNGALPCANGFEFSSHREFWRRDTVAQVGVSTNDCPVEVEVLDLRNQILKTRGEAYESVASLRVQPAEAKSVSLGQVSGGFFVFVRAVTSPPPATTVEVTWSSTFTEPDPLTVSLGAGLLLLGGASVFIGLLLLVRETRIPELGAALAALAGLSFSLMPYAYAGLGPALGVLNLPAILGTSSLLMGLSGYFLAHRFLAGRSFGVKVGAALVGYFLVGAAVLSVVSGVRGQFASPLIVLPYWPWGVMFVLFSERVYDRAPIAALFEIALFTVLAAGLGVLLFSFWRRLAKMPQRA